MWLDVQHLDDIDNGDVVAILCEDGVEVMGRFDGLKRFGRWWSVSVIDELKEYPPGSFGDGMSVVIQVPMQAIVSIKRLVCEGV